MITRLGGGSEGPRKYQSDVKDLGEVSRSGLIDGVYINTKSEL